VNVKNGSAKKKAKEQEAKRIRENRNEKRSKDEIFPLLLFVICVILQGRK